MDKVQQDLTWVAVYILIMGDSVAEWAALNLLGSYFPTIID